MAPRRRAKATLKATGDKTTQHDDGDGRHYDSNVLQDNMRHDDGDGRHNDGAR
jgi:hypothetical protein